MKIAATKSLVLVQTAHAIVIVAHQLKVVVKKMEPFGSFFYINYLVLTISLQYGRF